MAEVQLREVVKRYGKMTAVHGISLDIEDKQFVALVGPSGCGKTTTLRMVAGLESISEGDLLIGGKRVNNVAPKNRDIAMVFQNYALYPHMSVYRNIAFGLQMRRMSKVEIDTTVRDAARILEIEHLLDRRPGQLSGGQRQRVAMGRAIVRHPQVFLFDEPLSNLDAKLRVQMRAEIKRVHRKVDTTILYVTHDQVEAMTMADSIVVMNQGRIEQHGTPHELYHHPRTRFVAGFIGSPTMNFLPARMEMSGESLEIVLSDGIRASVPEARRARYAPYVGKDLLLGVRPEHFYGQRPSSSSPTLDLRITPDIVEVMGMESIIYFQFAGQVVCAKLESGPGIASGTITEVHADLDHMHIIEPETDLVV